jgi:hypothetical protein
MAWLAPIGTRACSNADLGRVLSGRSRASPTLSTLAGGTACILSLSEHATFARLIHCMAAAELGNRQSFTKAERCHARAAFFMEVGARLLIGTGMESK